MSKLTQRCPSCASRGCSPTVIEEKEENDGGNAERGDDDGCDDSWVDWLSVAITGYGRVDGRSGKLVRICSRWSGSGRGGII